MLMRSERFFAASALDWIAGDPPNMPHPVRLIGAAISTGERWLRRPAVPAIEIAQGAALTAAVIQPELAALAGIFRVTSCLQTHA